MQPRFFRKRQCSDVWKIGSGFRSRSSRSFRADLEALNMQQDQLSQNAQKYSNWTNNDLIKRVSDLEAQLRISNAKLTHSILSNASVAAPKKQKKAVKAFDPSKYSTRLIALKFAYLGGRYNGFEHHTNNKTPLPTVEDELWKALRTTKLISPKVREGANEDEVCWDECYYSKCGRTDKGVSAFGQVIALRVRSSRPKQGNEKYALSESAAEEDGVRSGVETGAAGDSPMPDGPVSEGETKQKSKSWSSIKDELPYIQLLNRVLPSDIRMLAWCPNPPPEFSARFNCKERRYRYFFTNPAYVPTPTSSSTPSEAWLDLDAMKQAAKKLEGLHDFRNFCKMDPSKQIYNFHRKIFSASIEPVTAEYEPGAFLSRPPFANHKNIQNNSTPPKPNLYYFEVRGSAFLWHQVRHMIAILFLVGQGYEDPSIVDHMLNISTTPAKPHYEMASDASLVLWDCEFPDPTKRGPDDHSDGTSFGYEDALDWVYVGDETHSENTSVRRVQGMEDRKYGRMGIMEDLWIVWRKRKMDEVLAGCLMDVVSRQGKTAKTSEPELLRSGELSARVFDGSECPRTVGRYVPIMQRERMETAEVSNARWIEKRGLNGSGAVNREANVDE